MKEESKQTGGILNLKILILEDSVERIAIFNERLNKSGVDLFITDQVNVCIEHLKNDEIHILMLDHDLGGKIYVESDGDEPTGWHVAKWLNEHPDRIPETVIVHSLNESGRKNILSMLPDAVDSPGAWMVMELKDQTVEQKEIGEIL